MKPTDIARSEARGPVQNFITEFNYAVCDETIWFAEFSEWLLRPPLATLGEDRLQVAVEKRAGVLEIRLGVRAGLENGFERLVENGDDPLLLRQGWNRDRNFSQGALIQFRYGQPRNKFPEIRMNKKVN